MTGPELRLLPALAVDLLAELIAGDSCHRLRLFLVEDFGWSVSVSMTIDYAGRLSNVRATYQHAHHHPQPGLRTYRKLPVKMIPVIREMLADDDMQPRESFRPAAVTVH